MVIAVVALVVVDCWDRFSFFFFYFTDNKPNYWIAVTFVVVFVRLPMTVKIKDDTDDDYSAGDDYVE